MKIHFIHIYEPQNAGEMACGPYDYFGRMFAEYFEVQCHDLRYLDLNKIDCRDWVILGGGGLFNLNNKFQTIINNLLNKTYKIITWGIGHNFYDGAEPVLEVNFKKIFYYTTRDFNYSSVAEFLPCVSCMHNDFDRDFNVTREVGVIEHFEHHINEFSYDKITNMVSTETMMHFIASSNCIVTNSYHALYWAMLMNKKTICYKPFSSKFNYFEYKPVVYSGNLEKDLEKPMCFTGMLDKYRKMNVDFADKILKTIKTIELR